MKRIRDIFDHRARVMLEGAGSWIPHVTIFRLGTEPAPFFFSIAAVKSALAHQIFAIVESRPEAALTYERATGSGEYQKN